MTDKHSVRGLLHRATHRIPGVPDHAEQPGGHQGPAHQGHSSHRGHPSQQAHPSQQRVSLNQKWNHSPARPPRVLAAWQRRIATFFNRAR